MSALGPIASFFYTRAMSFLPPTATINRLIATARLDQPNQPGRMVMCRMPGKAARSGCSTSVWVRGMQAIVGTAHRPCWKGKMRKYSRWFGVHLGYANVSGRNLRRGRFRFLNASPRDSTLLPSRLSIGSLRIPVFPAPLDFLTCRSFATISSALCLPFRLKAILQEDRLQRGRPTSPQSRVRSASP